jgi:FkbM family methyltransferase
MNFSALSNKNVLGRLIRSPLALIPADATLPVLQGRLRGKKWIVGSSIHGCWLGSYEYGVQQCFGELIKSGDIVFDIGANVGFYTLLASVLVGPTGKVFSFEPVRRNIVYLRKHLQLNSIRNVSVVECAISDRSGTALFDEGPSSSMGCLSAMGSLSVATATLDELFSSAEISAPNYIKIDVEGAEAQVLAGAKRLLEDFHPTLFLSTHGIEPHTQCCRFLNDLGYEVSAVDKKSSIEDAEEILAVHSLQGSRSK